VSIGHWQNIIGIAGPVSIVTGGGFLSFWLADLGWNTHRPGSMVHAVLQVDQAQPVRRIARGAKHGAAGMGVEPIPGGQA
jgi:hypothetical protein